MSHARSVVRGRPGPAALLRRPALFLALLGGLLGTVPGRASSQDVSDLELGGFELPVRLSGTARLVGELYHAAGVEGRRPGSTWRMSFTPTVALFGDVTMGVDLLVSDEESRFRQNVGQLGLSPTWSWGTLHVGDFSRDYSALMVQGSRIRGGGLDLEGGPWRVSVQGGRVQRTATPSAGQAVFKRNMIAARAGWEGGGGDRLLLTVLGARDQLEEERELVVADTLLLDTIPEDLRPEVDNRPQENLALGVEGGVTLFDALSLDGEVATSLLTRDRTADEVTLDQEDVPVPGFVTGLATVHTSTSLDLAWSGEARLDLGNARLGGGYERVGAGYGSLGLPYLVNDRRGWNVDGALRLLDGRLSLQGGHRDRLNNLESQRKNTVARVTSTMTVAGRPVQDLQATLSVMTTSVENDAVRDSSVLDTRSSALTTNLSWQRSLVGLPSVLSMGYNLQRTTNGSPITPVPEVVTHNLTSSVQVTLTRRFSVAPSVSAVLTRGEGMEGKENVHLGFRGNGRFLEGELRTSADVSHTVSQGRDVFTTSARASYPVAFGADLSFRLRHTRFTTLGDRPGFEESFATFTVSRSF